jgi:hypothetical protein
MSGLRRDDVGNQRWRPVLLRCHIGHAYTQDTITAGVDERLKRALATGRRHSMNVLLPPFGAIPGALGALMPIDLAMIRRPT